MTVMIISMLYCEEVRRMIFSVYQPSCLIKDIQRSRTEGLLTWFCLFRYWV